MTTFKYTDYRFSSGFFLLALCSLLLWPVNGMALPECSFDASYICTDLNIADQDCDGDGFTNAQECDANGLTTVTGETIDASTFDPGIADLFFLVTDLDGNDLQETDAPTGESSLLFAALDDEGVNANALKFYNIENLKVRAHRIPTSFCSEDRTLVGNVRAAQIVESLSITAEGSYIGSTQQGVPSNPVVFSTIYTKKIKNDVDKNCPMATPCAIKGTSINNSNGTDNTPIISHYMFQVIAHEMGHGSMLAPTTARSYYHYSRSGTVMDPAASFRKGVYDIPTVFDPAKDPGALSFQ